MASVSTVRDNVARTIAGKQALLAAMRTQADSAHGVTRTALTASIGFIELNLEELERILADLDACLET